MRGAGRSIAVLFLAGRLMAAEWAWQSESGLALASSLELGMVKWLLLGMVLEPESGLVWEL